MKELTVGVLSMVIVISIAVIVSGVGYIWLFSGILGNSVWLSPAETQSVCTCLYNSDLLRNLLLPGCS